MSSSSQQSPLASADEPPEGQKTGGRLDSEPQAFVEDASAKPEVTDSQGGVPQIPVHPPGNHHSVFKNISPFWKDRLIEGGMILSITLYYIMGNSNLGKAAFFHINPLFSLPFLLLFGILCWYRLSFAVALFPLTLPYYLYPKIVFQKLPSIHYEFSIAEITLLVCLVVAVLQLLLRRQRWQYWLSWRGVQDRLGPFIFPMLLFFLLAALSISIAYSRADAQRAFREEVVEPLLYVLLILFCLRSRQDITRLFIALFGTGFVVALFGMGQFFFFRNYLVLESDGILRVYAMYGNANSIGLLFDYVLPLGLAFIICKTSTIAPWRNRLVALVLCLPLLYVLYLSQSFGAWTAIAVAVLFMGALSIRNRKVLWGSLGIFGVAVVLALLLGQGAIRAFIENHHSIAGVSTVTKRLYLWQSAWHMIQNSPWLGYGMDNWLCHYSKNTVCDTHIFHYWILTDPVTHVSTGLSSEPDLSHPHNIFLHVWVSIGIFGLLAFFAVIVLFFWLFARILAHLRSLRATLPENADTLLLRAMTIGIGAALVAALVQGQVDSAFLEQDLAFCFWTLVAALLVLRVLSGASWRKHIS